MVLSQVREKGAPFPGGYSRMQMTKHITYFRAFGSDFLLLKETSAIVPTTGGEKERRVSD